MAVTQLSPSALPGRRYSFAAKDPAPISSGTHTGLFTRLSVQATPGKRNSFAAKTPASTPSGPHTGLFTALSVAALPGPRRTFVAKAAAALDAGYYAKPPTGMLAAIRKDDEEFIELLTMVLPLILD